MVTAELQRDLVKEVGEIIKDIRTKNTKGELVSGAHVYEQRLPIIAEDEEDESLFFPYAIVKVTEASTADDESPWIVPVDIYFGIHDAGRDGHGHRSVLNMIQRIVDRFAAAPLLNGKFRAQQEIHIALQDEDTYPFYLGGVEIKFQVPKIQRRDPFV